MGVGWCFASDQLMDNVDMEVLIRNTLCGSLRQKTKKNIGVSTYAAHKYTDFPTHDVVVMGSSDTPSTHLMAQPLAETLKKKD